MFTAHPSSTRKFALRHYSDVSPYPHFNFNYKMPVITCNKRPLQAIAVILNFVRQFHSDYQAGNALTGYSQEEFPLPASLSKVVMNILLDLENSVRLEWFLTLLRKRNRIDHLIDFYMNSFSEKDYNGTESGFIIWTIMCCFVSTVLHEMGFREALFVAIETINGMCFTYKRYGAFRMYGIEI